MLWYDMTGRDNDVVVSSRIRLARNLANYPFEGRLSDKAAHEIIDRVNSVFKGDSDYSFTDFQSLPELSRISACEQHLVSREFAAQKSPCALISSEKNHVYIMVLEEDHVRIQAILPGNALEEAYREASEADARIDSELDIAYD